jgi:hypothetical protein
MAPMNRPRLHAVAAQGGSSLSLTWVDGATLRVDLTPLFEESPGLRLRRAPTVFARVCLGEGGWTVAWPELDSFWNIAQPQCAQDENTRVFARRRARSGLSLRQAAEALGMTPRTMSAYGSDRRPVPKYITLVVKGWESKCSRAGQLTAPGAAKVIAAGAAKLIVSGRPW